jgi:hypothetical protein
MLRNSSEKCAKCVFFFADRSLVTYWTKDVLRSAFQVGFVRDEWSKLGC